MDMFKYKFRGSVLASTCRFSFKFGKKKKCAYDSILAITEIQNLTIGFLMSEKDETKLTFFPGTLQR